MNVSDADFALLEDRAAGEHALLKWVIGVLLWTDACGDKISFRSHLPVIFALYLVWMVHREDSVPEIESAGGELRSPVRF